MFDEFHTGVISEHDIISLHQNLTWYCDHGSDNSGSNPGMGSKL